MQNFNQIINYCQTNHIVLSKQQLIILEIIFHQNLPIAPHELLIKLKQSNPKANRMTIHRALDKLIKQNLVHKIQYNNTYSICKHISEHNCQILICIKCNKQSEIHSPQLCHSLNKLSQDYNFTAISPIEITGICLNCQ